MDSQKNPIDIVLNLNKNRVLRYKGIGYRVETREERERILIDFCLIKHLRGLPTAL